MKKIIAMLLAVMLVASMAACGGNTATTPATTEAKVEVPASALEILEKVWADYADEEKFSIIGGNIEANIMDAPGNYDMAYAENLTWNLLVPEDQLPRITEAASMIHMMNANTFTCGVFRLQEGTNPAEFAAVMENAVMNNQWMCGFPEDLLIVTVADTYVVMAFGITDAMSGFTAHLSAVYPDAQTLYSQKIV